ncbi:hypothetical protein C810_01492 [Lachnospiraceae bacterium A2]|nr:hypothetical protein C810_01492 [Lachnospiraceae bacterium A2]
MERLTKYSNDLIRNKAVNILRKLDSENGLNGDELAIISSFCFIERMENKELKKYEDLEEQGKLLKLPCAVGDTVYYADNEYYFTVLPVKVDEISIMESNAILYKCLLFDGNGDVETQFDFDKDDFGKTVFLTRQEAEDKLAEMEGKK